MNLLLILYSTVVLMEYLNVLNAYDMLIRALF